MYQAKGSGKNRVCLFSDEMNERSIERFELVSGLREAVHSGQLQLMFQPQVNAVTEEIVGVETLVRWHHPTRGIVSPANFIGVAEDAGVMVQLGEWVLRSACEAARTWVAHSQARVAVNLSGRQLDHPDFSKRVKKILAESGLPASRLELELTESLATNDTARRTIAELRALGIRVAIDDFGTGYSSLTLLKRLNIDMLKIDQSFVRGAAQTDPDRVILAAIIHMARGLGLDVMAEGVETVDEMRALLDRGCPLMQGYPSRSPSTRTSSIGWCRAPKRPGVRCSAIPPRGPLRRDSTGRRAKAWATRTAARLRRTRTDASSSGGSARAAARAWIPTRISIRS
jgi:EAL domain-containing protein (putative c-di-GMP-specific phosphodiesterase class I)